MRDFVVTMEDLTAKFAVLLPHLEALPGSLWVEIGVPNLSVGGLLHAWFVLSGPRRCRGQVSDLPFRLPRGCIEARGSRVVEGHREATRSALDA